MPRTEQQINWQEKSGKSKNSPTTVSLIKRLQTAPQTILYGRQQYTSSVRKCKFQRLEKSKNWTRNNQKSVDAFAEHLQNWFQPNSGLDVLPELQRNDNSDTMSLVTTSEVPEKIRHLNSKKAPAFDMITGMTLKNYTKKGTSKINQSD